MTLIAGWFSTARAAISTVAFVGLTKRRGAPRLRTPAGLRVDGWEGDHCKARVTEVRLHFPTVGAGTAALASWRTLETLRFCVVSRACWIFYRERF